ncbi:hypothetical protein AVEN_228240-1 [Araneus ventricosus]|uniref:Uncharacterized protein n=1 Tax=Araneus ventricosus TaxID=182803 RepID=A0A4Y2G8W9_ARAVE|nr:hypothetical protein AVEN_228240-1 [Araneus ventricosus]
MMGRFDCIIGKEKIRKKWKKVRRKSGVWAVSLPLLLPVFVRGEVVDKSPDLMPSKESKKKYQTVFTKAYSEKYSFIITSRKAANESCNGYVNLARNTQIWTERKNVVNSPCEVKGADGKLVVPSHVMVR